MTRRRILIVLVILLIPVAIHAIWDQVEATLLAREVARIAQRGEPINLAFLRFQLPTPEQRNAARVYAAAADLAATKYRDNPRPGSRDDELERAFASGKPNEMLDDLRRQFVENEPAFTLLAQASTLDFTGFGPAAPELYENASPLVGLSDLNCLRADILTAQGDATGSAGALIQSVRLQRTIAVEFYRYLALRRLYGSVRLLLRHAAPDGDALLGLQQAFEQLPDRDSLPEQLRLTRARLLGDFWPHPPGESAWAFRGRLSIRDRNGIPFVLFRPLITRMVRNQLKPFEEAMDVAAQPWPVKVDASNALAQRYSIDLQRGPQRRRSWLDRAVAVMPSALGVGTLDSYMLVAGMDLAMRRTSITALAVERYRRAHNGEAPASLSDLVPEYLAAVPLDPYSGQPLPYRRAADNYVVYSIAQNRADDGGGLYGLGSGGPPRRPNEALQRGGDIGIRIALTPVH